MPTPQGAYIHSWTANKLLKGAGAGADPTEIDVPLAGIWTLLETLSPAGVASINSSALTAYDMFMVIFRVTEGTASFASYFAMKLNGDGGGNYCHVNLTSGNSVTNTSGDARFRIAGSGTIAVRWEKVGKIYLPGKKGAVRVPIGVVVGQGDPVADYITLSGFYIAAANITSFTFLSATGTMTGKIQIYGMDFP